ncbi:glycoside hydrolase family 88 protein [bacterium]|nr:glycoside hydrolase family 88 protein [bacterium]
MLKTINVRISPVFVGWVLCLMLFKNTLYGEDKNTIPKTENSQYATISMEDAGNLLVQNLLSRDYMYYGEYGLHYSEACAAVGAFRFSYCTGDQESLQKLIQRYQPLLRDTSRLVSRRPHVDQAVIGIVPLQIYLITKHKAYLDQGLSFADTQWDSTIANGLTYQTRWWIDDIYMVGMLQIQAYRATRQLKYADRAADQLVAYLEKLQQENGLFFHGPDHPYCWGRGNGWVAAGMTEVLTDLPNDHPYRPKILEHYRKMMVSLINNQSDNGMWRQIIDYPYAWTESSCTAMFAYAISAGIKHGWLEDSKYRSAVEKAWKALAAHIDRQGNVREICVGTGQSQDLDYYLKRPREIGDFHGQAPVLWFIADYACRHKK